MSEITYLVIGMTQSRWDNPTVKNACGTALARIYNNLSQSDTPTQAQIDYALQGWSSGYRVIANPDVTVYIFCDSVQNLGGDLKDTFTEAYRDTLVGRVKADPQISAGFTRDVRSIIASWGVEPKPTEGP